MDAQTPYHQYLAQIHSLIAAHFGEQDLRTLCFTLGINYDDLPGKGNAAQARELIIYLHRTRRLPELVPHLRRQRPAVFWPDLPEPSGATPFTIPLEWNTRPGPQISLHQIITGAINAFQTAARWLTFHWKLALLVAGLILCVALAANLLKPQSQSLIIVCDFEDRSGSNSRGIDPAQYIYEKLVAQTQQDHLTVRIERLRQVVDDSTAKSIGQAHNATLVLWGWYDALTITPRLERIKTLSESRSTEEWQRLDLPDPKTVEFSSIIKDLLPAHASYLVLFTLGMDEYANRHNEKAVTYLHSAQAAASGSSSINPAETYFFIGDISLFKDDYDHAIADYTQAIQLKPDYAEAYDSRGLAYGRKRELDLAIADYDQAIQLKPDDATAYNNRGFAYVFRGDYDRAFTDFDQAIQFEPDLAVAYVNRGAIYGDRGDYDRAIADFDQAIQFKPNFADAYYNRGSVYDDKGDYNRAIADFDQAIKLQPDLAEAYNNRGNAYNNKGDYDRAIADCTQALKLQSDLVEAYNNRGNAYNNKGDYDRAIADFDQAIQLQPSLAEPYSNRGIAYYHQGSYDRAFADFDQAIQLKPDYVAYNNRGRAYALNGDYDRAITDYDQAIQLKPDFAKAYNNRGLAYADKGELDLAIADYDQAIQIEPDYADAYLNRGLAYKLAGEKDKAIADFEHFLQLPSNSYRRQQAKQHLRELKQMSLTPLDILAGVATLFGDIFTIMSVSSSAVVMILAVLGVALGRCVKVINRIFVWNVVILFMDVICLLSLIATGGGFVQVGLVFRVTPATMGIWLFVSFLLLVARFVLPPLIVRVKQQGK